MRVLSLLAMGSAACAARRPLCDAPAAAASHGPERVVAARRYLATCARGEVVALTQALIAFPTVSSTQSAATAPAFHDMARFLEEWARAHGLGFRVVGAHDAWEVTFGDGPRSVGLVMHADVVPAGSATAGQLPAGWSAPPFAGQVRAGRLYGRGSEDDKGPIAAALVALAALAQSGAAPHGQVMVILGTGEEHDWSGMERYAASEPKPRFVVSVDAGFPVVVAESGFVAWELESADAEAHTGGPRVVAAQGGEFLTQVPGEAWLKLAPAPGSSLDALAAKVSAAVKAEAAARAGERYQLASILHGDHVEVRVSGVAVHSSVAEAGHNALWPLAGVAHRLGVDPSAAATLLAAIHSHFDGDFWGERLGLAYRDGLMGRLLVAPTVLRSENGRAQLRVNMRRPQGMSREAFGERLDAALRALNLHHGTHIHEVIEKRYVGDPAVADTRGPLVDTLLAIYRRHTGDTTSAPLAIRGGTYARLFAGAVSFGPSLPGEAYRGHAPDEYIAIDTLDALTRMLFDAVVELDLLAHRSAGGQVD